jgi:hypothetical protein
MGILGSQIGGFAGAGIGEALGKKFGGSIGQEAGKNIGRAVGSAAGMAIPYFKEGGAVKKTGLAVVHKGEYVLPASIKPTKAQKSAVDKLHKAKKGGKKDKKM